MKEKKKSKISVLIVSKGRIFELKRLLFSLQKSSKLSDDLLDIYLGIEKNSYKNLPKFKNLKLKKIFFEKGTSPIVIKNYLYDLNPSLIKIFLDDDVDVKENFIQLIKNFSKKKSDCFLRLNAVKYFSKQKEKISITNSLEFVGFVEIGEKKLKKLIKLSYVAEDTELCNRIIKEKKKIYAASNLQILHHISKKNRNFKKINFNGISNSIEILRGYGALSNFKKFNELIFYILISIFYYRKYEYIKVLLNKIFVKNININFFNNREIILPPFKNYFLDNYSVNKKKLINEKKLSSLNNYVITRVSTFEKYQELEKFLNKATYVGPAHDKIKIKRNFIFSKFNLTIDTFKNLNFYKSKLNKNFNLIVSVDDQISFYEQLYIQLNDQNFFESLKKVDHCLIFKNNKFYKFEKNKFFKFIKIFNFLTLPLRILSIFLYILLIFPAKYKG